MTQRSGLALAVLALAAEEPMHPYRMQQLMRERGKDQVVNVGQRSQLYKTIDRLVRDDLLVARATEREATRPERTVYAATDAGRELAITWTLDMLTAPRHEFAEFTAALAYLPLLDPEVAADALAPASVRPARRARPGAPRPRDGRRDSCRASCSSRPSTRSRTSRPTSPGSPPCSTTCAPAPSTWDRAALTRPSHAGRTPAGRTDHEGRSSSAAGPAACASRTACAAPASTSPCTSATAPAPSGLHGYRVGISPNGARALKACLDPELFATFVATTAAPYDTLAMLTERYRTLITMTFDDFPHTSGEPEDREHNVSRMTLRQVLFTGMEDVITFDRRFTHYTQHPDGRVTAHFDDGSSDTGDLLVGADGAGSPVRRQYLPHATHTETGLVGIGGKTLLTERTEALLPEAVRTASGCTSTAAASSGSRT